MKFIQYILTATIILLLSTHAIAANKPVALNSLLNNIKSMQADFVQTIYDNKGKVVQKAYGLMDLQRPGKFRWQVIKPIPQTIIINNQKLWIYDADLDQVTIRYLDKNQSDTPALLLNRVNNNLQDKFIFQILPSHKKNWYWYQLKPKQADSMFAVIKIGFYQNKIKEMQLQDHLGHNTIIQFDNIQMNNNISSAVFTLKIPQNVDVIDETKSE